MRNKNLQKKAVDYGMKKLSPFVVDTVGSAMDQLSTKVRPKNQKYKTDRPDLDGKGVDIHKMIENSQDQKRVGLLASISTWELIILFMNNLNTILKLEKS